MKAVVFFLLILISGLTHAQDYAVTQKNDTLRGKVQIQGYDIIDRVDVVQPDKKSHFTCIQLKSVFIKGETYTPVKSVEGAYRMMKLIRSGFLSLYKARRPNSYVYENDYLVKKDGTAMEVPGLYFKKVLMTYLGDCQSVSDKIKSEELKRKDIDKVVEEYNKCLQAPKITEPVVTVITTNPTLEAIKKLQDRIEVSSLSTKKDASDILKDLAQKTAANQPIPNYLLEGLKETVKDAPEFKEETDQLVALIRKP
ncbi:MAG: hypothetical protein HOP08_17490 [Cyclobacteriaceae bacterium]|nr:hypothetical protein [Cyclobacteriaceae bacterium]